MLTLRGFAIDEPLRQRTGQASIEQLERWRAEAITAKAPAVTSSRTAE